MKTLVKVALGIIALFIVIAVIEGLTSKKTPTPATPSTNAAPGVPSYRISEVSFLVASPSKIEVSFNVTNVGGEEGTPGCILTARTSSGVKSVGSKLLSPVEVSDVDIATVSVAIRDDAAADIPSGGVSVNCQNY